MGPIVVPPLRDGDLELRPPTPADVAAITAICQDPEIQRWTRVPSPYTEEDARSFVLMTMGALAEGTGVHLLAVPSGGPPGEVWGCVGVSIDARDLTGELGYWVASEARGRRVATRAARLVAGYALGPLGLGSLHLIAGADNGPSNAVARAVGFQLVGTRRSAMIVGPSGHPEAPRSDATLYDLLPGEVP